MERLQALYASYVQRKSEKHQETIREQLCYQEEIDQFYRRYHFFGTPPYTALRQALFEKEALMRRRDEIVRTLSTLPQDNESEIEAIRQREQVLHSQIRELELVIARGSEELLHLEEAADETEEERSALHALCVRRSEYERRLDILAKSEQFLRQAKKGMEVSYLGATRDSLHRVLSTLGVIDAEQIRINQQLELSREEHGLSRPLEAFSRGEGDLYRLAMRLSLIETLYGNEDRPPILLDDPFVTFDDARVENALFYLRAIGRNTQILYLTCSSARAQ